MEGALALLHSGEQPFSHGIVAGIVGELEIVDAGHYTRQVVVRSIWVLAWFADDSKHRREAAETPNRKLRASRNELKEFAALAQVKLAHDLQQIFHAAAIHVVAVVGLDGIGEGWILVNFVFNVVKYEPSLLSSDQSSFTLP